MPKPPASLWVTGGGVHHPVIMRMLTENFGKVQNVRQLNLNPDTLEAECFAWLAVRHTKGLPLTIPETTGCSRSVCGGTITC
jgi:anhydro-N-acetylmuramic acid kinase